MSLIKTSLWNSIAVAVKVSSALALNKLLAVMLGPAGFALMGQFQNAVGIVTNLVSGTLTTGITKYTAEYFDDEHSQQRFWQTGCRLMLYFSLGIVLCLVLFREPLSTLLFKRKDFSDIFIWLAIALPGIGLNSILLAIINGKKEFRIYVIANIAGNIVSFFVIAILALQLGVRGALIALGVSQAVAVLVTLGLAVKVKSFSLSKLWGNIEPNALKDLCKFIVMVVTTSVCTPLAQIVIRNHLVAKFGLAPAGYWQAITKISEIYLMMITLTLSAYYLPRLSEIRSSNELKREIKRTYLFVLPLAAFAALIVYLLREFIVSVLFSPDFKQMTTLFGWQLIGDVVKIGSWILGYVLIAKASTQFVVITEIFFSVSLATGTILLTSYFGIKGAVIAFAINYAIHWCFMYYLSRHEFRKMPAEVL